jgi:hypothetical protein
MTTREEAKGSQKHIKRTEEGRMRCVVMEDVRCVDVYVILRA